MNYRKIWEQHNGPIPKDSDGFSYEIHHKDFNHNNNDINNLQLVTIKEHLQLHIDNGDWGAAMLIAKRLKLGPDYLSEIQKGKKRPGIGGVKRGTVPWNKGKSGCFSEEVRNKMSIKRKGNRYGPLKISDLDCFHIRNRFDSFPVALGDGVVGRNGKRMSPEWNFSKQVAEEYGVTPNQIMNILKNKRNVIQE